jgi:hypothetical protein
MALENWKVQQMPRALLIVLLLWAGVSNAIGKEAEAANEDVPKGPGFSAPQGKTNAPQGGAQKPAPSTGSVNGGGKSAPSGGGGGGAGGSKGGAPHK